ncbi:MAG: DUF2934 domain-containing protein [Thermodesulfobacteriota bacterium]|nr:DUF2934 domain-containing protein [Thermodesulfobacteriota bacterium]
MGIYDNMGHEIAKVAYELWEKGGCVPGRDLENWLEAERIVITRYAEKSTAKEKPKKAATWEKMPVELKKTSPREMKKEAPEKKAAARKTAKKPKSQKEGRETK